MRAFLLLTVVIAVTAAGCASSPAPSGTPTVTTTSGTPSPSAGGSITVETSKGSFTFTLLPDAAPKTTAHIAALAKTGFYDGIPFHRYVPSFVIQGGDPQCKGDGWKPENQGASHCGSGGSGTNVPLEVNPSAKHDYGAVGLARSQAPDSGDSQFYVVVNPDGSHSLDGQYCVFGKVTSGMDVVVKLRAGDVMTKVTAN